MHHFICLLVPPLELPDVSPLIIGKSYQAKIAVREYLSGNDVTEIYVTDGNLTWPNHASPRVYVIGLSDLNTENSAPVEYKIEKQKMTKRKSKILISKWDGWAFKRFFLDFKVRLFTAVFESYQFHACSIKNVSPNI